MSRSLSRPSLAEKGSSRPPAPRVLVLLVARWLAENRQKLLGLYFCLLFEPCMRPSEGLALRGFQLLPPIEGNSGVAGKWSLLIRARELGQTGKTGEYDTGVALDLARHEFLFPVLRLLAGTRGERQFLFPFSYTLATKEMENALKQLRCQQLQITPYALRHGGASEDRAVNARSQEEWQKRGGWKSFNSVRRYEKHARLSLDMSKIPRELLQQGPALERDLERLWKSSTRALAGPTWHNLKLSRICSAEFWAYGEERRR